MLAALAVAATAAAGPQPVRFERFVRTDLRLSGVAWTGSEWIYTSENTGRFEASGPAGRPRRVLVRIKQGGEEVRCAAAPGGGGFRRGDVYCHLPDDRVVRLGPHSVRVVAQLPRYRNGNSDGAMTFDRPGGRFGGGLVAATGGSSSNGGAVYVLHGNGSLDRVGEFAGPGGPDNLVIAPRRFGTASGWAVLAIDEDSKRGRLLAVDADGRTKELIGSLGNGLNPIAAIAPASIARGDAIPGLYLADTFRRSVYLARGGQLRSSTGSIVVGTEKTAKLWSIRPNGSGFQAVPLPTNLPPGKWNLESAAYVP